MSEDRPSVCNIPQEADYTNIKIIELAPEPPLDDYLQATALANEQAEQGRFVFFYLPVDF